MWWTGHMSQNLHTHTSAKRYFPPWRACAIQRQFRDREWRATESHCWHRTAFHVSWTLNINAWDANCLFAINAQCFEAIAAVSDALFSELYVMRVFSFQRVPFPFFRETWLGLFFSREMWFRFFLFIRDSWLPIFDFCVNVNEFWEFSVRPREQSQYSYVNAFCKVV